ncbi:bifunctional hydroxymethylpyrimidine kinase/phosphomethylpyrimidine kinase [Filimonas lacunae]|nr:bifunctional hydroxymethylpyrimidine kinase/phosphomethylpyrimidine kinase [Filimonas lacunae]
MNVYKYAPVLTIAGSDSGGGAGIQADIKTISSLGCYAASAITAVTVQNTLGVSGIHAIPVDIVCAQVKAVMDDIQPVAIKIGMVHSKELALALAATLQAYPQVPIVLDPVMISTSGHKLIEDETIAILKERLFPLAAIITPNLDEAAVLCGRKLESVRDMEEAADELLQHGSKAVLLKGGHLPGEKVYDVYCEANGMLLALEAPRIASNNVHGTGCTLSSAIASYLALGNTLLESVMQAKAYIAKAIEEGKDVVVGNGSGPVNHFFDPIKLQKYAVE